MYNVNFKTDQALYDKFKLLCTINKEKFQDKLTELIQQYVSENESLIENPKVQEKLQPELPPFFGDQNKWRTYINRSDKDKFKEIVTRLTFLRYLIQLYLIDRDKESKLFQILHDPKFFMKSDDCKLLQKNGIFQIVKSMEKEFRFPPITTI